MDYTNLAPEEVTAIRAAGVTKARLAANIRRVGSTDPQFATNADYVAFVIAAAGLVELPETAMDSYVDQFIDKTVYQLEVELSDAIVAAGDTTIATIPTPTLAGVPQRITMRQARLALLGAGLLSTVDAAIASLPSPQKEAAQIEWEYAAYLERSNGLVLALSASLNLTDPQLDALFTQAATL